jgi:hypothetical protein
VGGGVEAGDELGDELGDGLGLVVGPGVAVLPGVDVGLGDGETPDVELGEGDATEAGAFGNAVTYEQLLLEDSFESFVHLFEPVPASTQSAPEPP